MPLLLLPRGVAVSDVIDTPPVAGSGVVTQFPATSGAWRLSLEIAAPAAVSPDWYEVTQFYAGDRYQRGADEYKGKYRASLATVQLQIDNVQAADLNVSPDILAPWGQDTTDLFGINLRLGAGLMMRLSMIREVASVVVEWLPIWTGRVESWGDASFARGQTREHVVSVVDLIADLANVPVANPLNATTWPEYFEDQVLPAAGWQFGVDTYGDPAYSGLPGDEALTVAINRMDAGTDPLGLVWRSLRNGRLVIYPAPWDTVHVNRYPNPLLDVYPGGLVFSYSPDFTDIEYIADDDQQPFGITRNVAGIQNSFVITYPDGFDTAVYADDDPVSVSRYGVRPFSASWITFDPLIVDDLKASRAYSESQALPLRTTVDHEGFWTAMALVDHLDPVTVIHATSDDGLVVTGTGTVRNIVEERTVRMDGWLNWQSTIQIDIDSTETSEPLLPVEDLAFVSSASPGTGGPASAEFTWTNPTQPSITPTEVQYRVLARSLIWVSEDYPGVGADGTTINWLNPGTYYTLQVRLIRRVDGVVTNFSPLREVRFFTPNRIWPIPVPDGTDTGGEFPDTSDPDCDFMVELQENDGTGWVTVDTLSGAELTDTAQLDPAGNIIWRPTTNYPNSFFNDGSMYRYVSGEDCGSGFEVLFVGPEWDPQDDWTDPCPTPSILSDPPFNDSSLLVYVPKICTGTEDGDPDYVFNGMQIFEAVSGIQGVPGDALQAITSGVGDPEDRALLALAEPAWSEATFAGLAYGACPQIVGATGDLTITCRVKVVDAVACTLWECAAMRIDCVPATGGWRASVTVHKVGVTINLPTTTVLDEGTAYVITATHELATGDIRIFIDGVEDNIVSGSDNVPTINAIPAWKVGAPPESWITDCALFDSVTSGGWVVEYTDDFNRADSTNLGPNWNESGAGNLAIASNVLHSTSASGVFGMWTSALSDPDSYVQLDCLIDSIEVFIVLRATAANTSSGGYYAGVDSLSNYVIGKMGVGTLVSTAGASTTNKVMRFEADGSALTLYIDGVVVLSTTDATQTGTFAGLFQAGATGAVNDFEIGVRA